MCDRVKTFASITDAVACVAEGAGPDFNSDAAVTLFRQIEDRVTVADHPAMYAIDMSQISDEDYFCALGEAMDQYEASFADLDPEHAIIDIADSDSDTVHISYVVHPDSDEHRCVDGDIYSGGRDAGYEEWNNHFIGVTAPTFDELSEKIVDIYDSIISQWEENHE